MPKAWKFIRLAQINSMKNLRLAVLTIFALPVPVLAALISMHCHGAGFTNDAFLAEDYVVEEMSQQSMNAGQTITSFIISPAAITGGKSSTGTVYLRYPAKAGGVVVTLKDSESTDTDLPPSIVVLEGKTSAQFSIRTKPVSSYVSLNVSASCQNATASNVLTLLPPQKGGWYVAPDGSPKGLGTQNSPWDLSTALAHGPGGTKVKPGDTIWLREGRYVGTFVSRLTGRPDAPIIVRAQPGERVILDKAAANEAKQPALKVKGSWVWFWGIEVMNSNPDRRRNSPYSGKDEPWRGSGADVYAPNVKFINMIFHDNGHGIWDKKDMTEVHGCLFFYNGNNKREHALYIGNSAGTKYITDNIVFDQGGYGILAHSDSLSSSQKGVHIEGNVSFNNGVLTGDDQKTRNLQVGGVRGVSAERIVLKGNYIFNAPGNANHKNNGIRLGYEDMANKDLKVLDNYIVSRVPMLLWWWQDVEFQGNTIYSDAEGPELRLPAGVNASRYRWDFNTYYSQRGRELVFAGDGSQLSFARWQQAMGIDEHSLALGSRRPSNARIFVRPNRYEAGRANIVVYNWELLDRVAVDLSSVLAPGTEYEIRDAQNYFAEPVARGTFRGSPVFVPMKLSAMPQPIGNVERIPRHTAPEFGVFVLQAVSGKASR